MGSTVQAASFVAKNASRFITQLLNLSLQFDKDKSLLAVRIFPRKPVAPLEAAERHLAALSLRRQARLPLVVYEFVERVIHRLRLHRAFPVREREER